MVIAQREDVQTRVVANLQDDRYLDRVITETLRVYPLFGISHRITYADISVDERTTIPQGSVLCFNHPEYHRTGFEDPERFNPDRWGNLSPHDENYIPFGVPANRPCPASGLAPVTMRAAVRGMLSGFALYSSASHTRSVPNRGPCLIVSRTGSWSVQSRRTVLLLMLMRDRWEDVWRSLVQLVLGTYMVWDARRLRLCAVYFEQQSAKVDRVPTETNGAACPFHGHGSYHSSTGS
jgi:hypothetical protein